MKGIAVSTAKPDLVITAAYGYRWENLRPWVLSLINSGFAGDEVILGCRLDHETRESLWSRDIKVQQFEIDTPEINGYMFVNKYRFVPLIKFLAAHKHEYRYVIWTDAGDVVFQTNPAKWLEEHVGKTPTIVAAREGWRIEQEQTYNLPWLKRSFPHHWEQLQHEEVLCGGTVAGDADSMFKLMCEIYQMICTDSVEVNDQIALNYALRREGHLPVYIPRMDEGWVATFSAFKSMIALPHEQLTDRSPVFDEAQKLILTPDGTTPFALVHQYNRATEWIKIMREKYRWD